MAGTWHVINAPRFSAAYVTVLRDWMLPVKRLTSGYEFSGAEPHNWATAAGTTWYRGAWQTHQSSDIGIMEPGEFLHAKFACPTDFRVLTVDPKYVLDILKDAAFKGSHLRPGSLRQDELHALLRRACTTIEDATVEDLEREYSVRKLVLGVFARIGEIAPQEACMVNVRTIVRRARSYLHDNAFERIKLDDVASAVSCSKHHLERAFHAEFGAPIHRYLRLIKVERAITLIRAGDSLAEAAYAVGFADQAHMTRVFRSTLGVTPSTYLPERKHPRYTRRRRTR